MLIEIQKTMLFYPDRNKPFILETDAFNNEFGAKLIQDAKIVRFYSLNLSKPEINYSVMKKAIMSKIKYLEYFKHLIWNSKALIKTDNKDLISAKTLSSRAQRWKLRLREFNYGFQFISESKNFNADTLSRLYFIKCERFNFNVNTLKIFHKNGKLSYKSSGIHNKNTLIITYEQAKPILVKIHVPLLHPGIKKMTKTIGRYISCQNLQKIVSQIISECIICLK